MVNKVILLGTVDREPEVRYTQNGKTVVTLSVATKRSWNDMSTGERKEHTDWHRVVCYGGVADSIKETVQRGSSVYVEGALQTRKWQDKEGRDRYITEVKALLVLLLGSNRAAGHDGHRQPTQQQPQRQEPQRQEPQRQGPPTQSQTGYDPQYGDNPYGGYNDQGQGASGNFDDFDDDIPF